MPVSATTATVSMTVPDAVSLNQATLDQVYAGVKSANASHVTLHLPWATLQPTRPTYTVKTTRVVTTTVTTQTSQTITAVTTVTTKVGDNPETVTTTTTTKAGTGRGSVPTTTSATTTTTATVTNPNFVWAGADLAVNRAIAAGLKITIVLAPPRPSWAVKVTDTAFAGFASAVANRYKSKGAGLLTANASKPVTDYQVWHYPNIDSSWGDAPSASEYVGVLRAASNAIKAASTTNTVIFGNLHPCTDDLAGQREIGTRHVSAWYSPQTFLRLAYAAGAKDSFTALAYTPLSLPSVSIVGVPSPSGDSIKQSDSIRAVMTSNGDSAKKIYWTIGYDTTVFTQVQQAYYLDRLRRLAEARKDHVARLALYSYRD